MANEELEFTEEELEQLFEILKNGELTGEKVHGLREEDDKEYLVFKSKESGNWISIAEDAVEPLKDELKEIVKKIEEEVIADEERRD